MTSLNKLLLRGRDPEPDTAASFSQGSGSSQHTPKVPVILKRADGGTQGGQAPSTRDAKGSVPATPSAEEKTRTRSQPEKKPQILQRTGTPLEPVDRDRGNTNTTNQSTSVGVSLFDILKPYEFPYEHAVPIIHNDLSLTTNRKFLKPLKSSLDYLVVTIIGPPGSGKSTILNYLADDAGEFNADPKIFLPRKENDEEKMCSFYVTPRNIIFIEMASIFNGSAAVDLIPMVDKYSTLESLTVENAFGGNSHAELFFVANKCSLTSDSKDQLASLSGSVDIIGFGRRTRIKPNVFILPHCKDSKVSGTPNVYEEFRRKIYEYNQWTRSSFVEEEIDGQAKIPQSQTIMDWFTFASSAWEELGNPNFYQEYLLKHFSTFDTSDLDGFLRFLVGSFNFSSILKYRHLEHLEPEMFEYYNPFCRLGLCSSDPDEAVATVADSLTANQHCPVHVVPLEVQLVFCFFAVLSVFFQVLILGRMEEILSRYEPGPQGGEGSLVANENRSRRVIRTLPSLRKSLRVLFRSRAGSDAEKPAGVVQDKPIVEACGADHPPIITLHQFQRGDEAPAEVNALRIESALRILKIEYKVQFDATVESGIWISFGKTIMASGSSHCLDYVKTLSPQSMPEWDIPAEFAIPGRFTISLLKGDFPGLVTIYKRGLWKGGKVFKRDDLKTPSELEFAGTCRKDEVLAEIEKSLIAFNASLGDKDFILGKHICVADAFAFAILAQMTWTQEPELKGLMKKFPQAIIYTKRVRDLLWEDWTPPNYEEAVLPSPPAEIFYRAYSSDGSVNMKRRGRSESQGRQQRSISTRTFPQNEEKPQ